MKRATTAQSDSFHCCAAGNRRLEVKTCEAFGGKGGASASSLRRWGDRVRGRVNHDCMVVFYFRARRKEDNRFPERERRGARSHPRKAVGPVSPLEKRQQGESPWRFLNVGEGGRRGSAEKGKKSA